MKTKVIAEIINGDLYVDYPNNDVYSWESQKLANALMLALDRTSYGVSDYYPERIRMLFRGPLVLSTKEFEPDDEVLVARQLDANFIRREDADILWPNPENKEEDWYIKPTQKDVDNIYVYRWNEHPECGEMVIVVDCDDEYGEDYEEESLLGCKVLHSIPVLGLVREYTF